MLRESQLHKILPHTELTQLALVKFSVRVPHTAGTGVVWCEGASYNTHTTGVVHRKGCLIQHPHNWCCSVWGLCWTHYNPVLHQACSLAVGSLYLTDQPHIIHGSAAEEGQPTRLPRLASNLTAQTHKLLLLPALRTIDLEMVTWLTNKLETGALQVRRLPRASFLLFQWLCSKGNSAAFLSPY